MDFMTPESLVMTIIILIGLIISVLRLLGLRYAKYEPTLKELYDEAEANRKSALKAVRERRDAEIEEQKRRSLERHLG